MSRRQDMLLRRYVFHHHAMLFFVADTACYFNRRETYEFSRDVLRFLCRYAIRRRYIWHKRAAFQMRASYAMIRALPF